MGLVLGEFGVGRWRCEVGVWGWDSVIRHTTANYCTHYIVNDEFPVNINTCEDLEAYQLRLKCSGIERK